MDPAAGTDRVTAARLVRSCAGWNKKFPPSFRVKSGIVVTVVAAGIFFVCFYFSRPGKSCGSFDAGSGSTGESCTYTTSRGIGVYGIIHEHGSRPWLVITGAVVAGVLLILTWLALRSGRYPTRDEALAFEENVSNLRVRIAAENPSLLPNFDREVAETRATHRMPEPEPRGQ
ncbi:hypothetical protein [Williamsia sp.]|uniref:hypothetical protein n=1 Tax=Williamsia sp. TaxID=1872085 RepID=UPI001A2F9649|nr:hypothetical protein [Williamsia sp.]MBJ7290274.1 hypothetical protein [Williamsia sp.]